MGGRPLPLELRERVMEAWDNGEGTAKELAERFKISSNQIHKWNIRRKRTGSVAPGKQGGARDQTANRGVDAQGEKFLSLVLTELPDSTIPELMAAYEEERGVAVGKHAIRSALDRLGYRFKRGSFELQQPGERTS